MSIISRDLSSPSAKHLSDRNLRDEMPSLGQLEGQLRNILLNAQTGQGGVDFREANTLLENINRQRKKEGLPAVELKNFEPRTQ